MRDAIQGMLSMSRGSRLLPGTALLRTTPSSASSQATQLFRRRSSYPVVVDDIDKKLMACYNDSEFGKYSGLRRPGTYPRNPVGFIG